MPYRKVGALEACWYMIRYKLKEALRMPRLPDHPCAHPGCPRLVLHGRKYCDAHAGKHPEETRSASSRGYGKRWQKASKAFLRRHPLCAECERNGRYVAATVVDHITPHRGDPKLFWDESNWQPLCKACHDRRRTAGLRTITDFKAPRGGRNLHDFYLRRPPAPLTQKKAGSNKVLTRGW